MPPTARSYFVCATPRSGSTLLCKSLSATGVAGKPEEYFERLRHSGIPREPREYFPGVTEPALLDLLPETRTGDPHQAYLVAELPRYLTEGTTPNGVFGSKMMWGYFDDLLGRLDTSPEAPDAIDRLHQVFGELRYIHVTRGDKVGQAVSLWRAVQTRAWSADDEAATAEPVYDERGIGHLISRLEAHDESWRAWFVAHGIAPLWVEYEAFVADHAGTLRRVLDFLGVEDEVGELPEPRMRRQADDRSAEWIERFHTTMAANAAEARA